MVIALCLHVIFILVLSCVPSEITLQLYSSFLVFISTKITFHTIRKLLKNRERSENRIFTDFQTLNKNLTDFEASILVDKPIS